MQSKVAAAFLAVYIIWGSTYLAIRLVIESLPSFFMASTRFLVAGSMLYVWTRLLGASRPSRMHWLGALVVGGLMLTGGHGAVVWAERWVPSGLTSVLIATVPLWMVLVDSLRSRSRPSPRVLAGLVLGFVGVALLIDPVRTLGGGNVDALGAGIIVSGAFLWACGSLYSRSGKLPQSPLQATSLEMLAGGALLFVASGIAGEWRSVGLDNVSTVSLASWLYLIIFGSLVAFTSYIWLLKQATPERVSTYAYVNPIVAMILGTTLANEPLTPQNVLATAVVLASVVLIIAHSIPKKTEKQR